MSTHAASAPKALAASPAPAGSNAGKALGVGIAGIILTVLGLALPGNASAVAVGWLVAIVFWTAIAVGMLMLIMIHHLTDAGWSVALRRQFEHGISSFKWLLLLFIPLLLATWLGAGDIVWPWGNLNHVIHGSETIADDAAYWHKSPILNIGSFSAMSVALYAFWIWVSARLRKASFTQDIDGDIKWTNQSHATSASTIALTALALTGVALFWIMSLEYHWGSTIYGMWFFSDCIRGALSVGLLVQLWLFVRGDFRGILSSRHLHCTGIFIHAFTAFWAYVAVCQYILIWSSNIPEETFWYNIRELNHGGATNQWWYVGLALILFNFLVPFALLLSYKTKIIPFKIAPIAALILGTTLLDLVYNIVPVLKDVHGDAQPFLSFNLVWILTSVIGVGGVCAWSYLRSFASTKLIPIRDPRIAECLANHE
ncbi:MAG TPA: hypothetical protein VL357_07425 [Rariglobus sp.]|jgi:hypothetical protein|nr:hypothetical protein [Rariglobus sp.]